MRSIVLLLCTLPSFCYSYNSVGHIVIAEAAFQMLDQSRQEKLSEYGDILRRTGGSKLRKSLDSYTGVSSFSKTVFLPDAMTKETIRSIYSNFEGRFPSTLQNYYKSNSANWHYIGYQFNQSNNCNVRFVKKHDNIEWALAKLIRGYNNVMNVSGRAITLAFIAHFVGDAHQPLRAVSMDIDPNPEECRSDEGGSLFCLSEEKENYRCKNEYSLRQYWDSSGYRINDRNEFKSYVKLIVSRAKKLDEDMVSMKIGDWTKESYALASKAYATQRDKWPSDSYQEMTYNESILRMALAAVRLKMLIEKLM